MVAKTPTAPLDAWLGGRREAKGRCAAIGEAGWVRVKRPRCHSDLGMTFDGPRLVVLIGHLATVVAVMIWCHLMQISQLFATFLLSSVEHLLLW